MKEKPDKINRRDFLRTVGAAGLGGSIALTAAADANEKTTDPNTPRQIQKIILPTRTLGKTGVKVPILALGMMFDALEKQIVLRKALELGVTYWDTAYSYGGEKSERGIAKFLAKNPDVRKKLFIATKASLSGEPRTIDLIEKRLHQSLKKLNISRIDLYYGMHDISNPAELTDDLRKWAESAKKRNLIRFFGISTHRNMPACLQAAAKLDWVDVVMTTYNFRVMQKKEMQDAVQACHKTGIGLVAMKTQTRKQKPISDEDEKVVGHFLKRGFTLGQAKLKAVLADKRFTSVSVGRDNISHLTLNVAAALDKTELTKQDMDVFAEYARTTCSGYCAGCANICSAACPDVPCISDVMRHLMYYNGYGDHQNARELFARIPAHVRKKLLTTDYSLAEARCPQHMPIAELIAEAVTKLA